MSFPFPPEPTMVATSVGSEITATREVNLHYADNGFGDLAEFFTSMVNDWRGWHGTRSWDSLEKELSLSARHTGSHVRLHVELLRAGNGR